MVRKIAVLLGALLVGCTKAELKIGNRTQSAETDIRDYCAPLITPKVDEINDHVFVATGFDLANTILIKTNDGNVVIDTGMSPAVAAKTRAALLAKSPGKIRAVIFTHSHIDHVGGAAAWVEPDTEVWASAAFVGQFFKQYGLFQPIEQLRAGRQYGSRVARDFLPCTAIGPIPDLTSALSSGARMPTKTFSGSASLDLGGVHFELLDARGETQDEIMIWLPKDKILFSGDNIFNAFPNLYTIRGTSPRPVDEWIASLDAMRRLEPETLVPSHTDPVRGAAAVRDMVIAYRDAVQWVRDATVRGANAGQSAKQIAQSVKLPAHLADKPYLQETYGQADWSARGIYDNELGWFAGEPEQLYPVPIADAARREVELMGGTARVVQEAEKALNNGDPRWATQLLAKVRDMGEASGGAGDQARKVMAAALDALASTVANTNGRGYLAQTAVELRDGPGSLPAPSPDNSLIQAVPIETIFRRMAVNLIAEENLDTHEALRFEFPDLQRALTLTIRRGVAEVAYGDPLPGTPTPVGTVSVDSMVWKRLAMKQMSLPAALASGQVRASGSWIGIGRFLKRFKVD